MHKLEAVLRAEMAQGIHEDIESVRKGYVQCLKPKKRIHDGPTYAIVARPLSPIVVQRPIKVRR